MKLTITAGRQRLLAIHLALINIMLAVPGLQLSTYLAPISENGAITAWKQRSQYYKTGFVARFLWLGFILRLGRARPASNYCDVAWEDTF